MKNFYKNKKVLITGHTGFKGSWLSKILSNWGANITGFSLEPPTNPNLFDLLDININSIIEDIRDFNHLKEVFDEFEPEIVIHMAAQPIVRESYENPVYTYETNVMGTVNICECVRLSDSVKSFLNVTTDKVYENKELEFHGYSEDEPLNGYDPYSNSKSCSELVTQSYNNSFFKENPKISISTARAGNVIGGGDFAKDRIIPDCVRAGLKGEDILIRNPYSTRPYQHVLEPLNMYLLISKMQFEDKSYSGYYNVGPNDEDCITTGELVDLFVSKWGDGLKWVNESEDGPHEANFLKLNCSKIKEVFGWNPRWNVEKAIEKTVDWTKVYQNKGDINEIMDKQIDEFFSESN